MSEIKIWREKVKIIVKRHKNERKAGVERWKCRKRLGKVPDQLQQDAKRVLEQRGS